MLDSGDPFSREQGGDMVSIEHCAVGAGKVTSLACIISVAIEIISFGSSA